MDDTIIIAEDYLLKQGVQVGVQRKDVAILTNTITI